VCSEGEIVVWVIMLVWWAVHWNFDGREAWNAKGCSQYYYYYYYYYYCSERFFVSPFILLAGRLFQIQHELNFKVVYV
jgi:hypothetical protein